MTMDLTLRPAADGASASFDTGALSGRIDAGGATTGFRELTFGDPPGHPANPRLYLGHAYRLLADGQYLTCPREEPHQGRVEGDQAIVTWDPLPSHDGQVKAVYQVSGETTLDLTITCRVNRPYQSYELYLSHYFAAAWRPYVYLRPAPFLARYPGGQDPVLWAPQVNEFIRGYYLAYPRDDAALGVLFDGRWHGDHPVPFAVSRPFWRPIGIYADALNRQAVVVTGRQSECFCLYGTYDTPDGRDNILHHNSLYFGMFGEDLAAGDVRTAHLRYHFVTWDGVDDLPLRLQQAWEEAADA